MFHKVIITLLKPLSFLPALLVMYMIFSFSAQNGTESGDLSFKVSVKLVEVGSEVLDMKLTDSEIQMYANKYHHYVRKLGHMTEYCVLAITLCVPLYAYGVRGIWLYLQAVIGMDNIQRNIFYPAVWEDGQYRIRFMPWDMDYTWGNVHDFDAGTGPVFQKKS